MRAGPLSDARVVEILNARFVPVFSSNDAPEGESEAERQAETKAQAKVIRAFLDAGLSAGAVSPYILHADGRPIARLDINTACAKGELLRLLQKVAAELLLPAGDPVVAPQKQMRPPRVRPGAAVLRLVTRKLGEKGSWNEFPAEDWIVLEPAEWRSLLGGPDGLIARPAAEKILTHFYPQTEITTARVERILAADGPYQHRVEALELRARPLPERDGRRRARLDGAVRIRHSFYPDRKMPNLAESRVAGLIEVHAASGRLASLRLATTYGRFDATPFAAALRLERVGGAGEAADAAVPDAPVYATSAVVRANADGTFFARAVVERVESAGAREEAALVDGASITFLADQPVAMTIRDEELEVTLSLRVGHGAATAQLTTAVRGLAGSLLWTETQSVPVAPAEAR